MECFTVLVTGGAGFIGSHLVDALIDNGHRVRVLDSIVPQVHRDGKARHINRDAEFITGDIRNGDVVERALDGVEVVFHQAAEVGVGQSMYEIERYVSANTLGTATLLQQMSDRRHLIKKMIVASSMSIYGEGAYTCRDCGNVYPHTRPPAQLARRQWDPTCPSCGLPLLPAPTAESKPLFPTSVYAMTKLDQEQLCLLVGRAYEIPTIALRYFNVYGSRQALSNPYTGLCAIVFSRLLNGRSPVIFEDGKQARDFVHVSDIVRANLLAMESTAEFTALNIGTGIATSVNEVTSMLSVGLGVEISAERVGKYREGDIRHCVADISLAEQLIGYRPTKRLADGIHELLEWVREESAEDKSAEAQRELEMRQLVR